MSGPEILPNSEDGLDVQTVRTRPAGGPPTTIVTYTGTQAAIVAKELELHALAPAMSGLASTVVTEGSNGRCQLVASYEKASLGNNLPGIEDCIQEFNAIKYMRDIYTADYFSTLTNAQILDVRNLVEGKIGGYTNYPLATVYAGFTDLQKKLYGHLTHGQEAVVELAYEFRQTWKTTVEKQIRKSLSGQNTVYTDTQIRALFNSSTKKLSSGTPALEWLKEPVQLTYLGKGYYAVCEIWTGLKQWSVIYGGTFTGIDPT